MTRLKAPPHHRIQPRGLSRVEAADYVGVSPTTFDKLVADGRMPPPKHINARNVWDVRQLDLAFEDLPSDDDTENDPFNSITF